MVCLFYLLIGAAIKLFTTVIKIKHYAATLIFNIFRLFGFMNLFLVIQCSMDMWHVNEQNSQVENH